MSISISCIWLDLHQFKKQPNLVQGFIFHVHVLRLPESRVISQCREGPHGKAVYPQHHNSESRHLWVAVGRTSQIVWKHSSPPAFQQHDVISRSPAVLHVHLHLPMKIDSSIQQPDFITARNLVFQHSENRSEYAVYQMLKTRVFHGDHSPPPHQKAPVLADVLWGFSDSDACATCTLDKIGCKKFYMCATLDSR